MQGWDEGVPQLSLGEKAVLTATRESFVAVEVDVGRSASTNVSPSFLHPLHR